MAPPNLPHVRNNYPHYPPYAGGPYDPYYPPRPRGQAYVPRSILHPALSAGSTVTTYDVKRHPREVIPADVYRHTGTQPFRLHSTNPPKHILVASKAFPWVIDIKRESPLTCKDVWKALHEDLQKPITTADWLHIARDGALKHSVSKAYEKRVKPQARSAPPMLRIDYLGENILFMGLEKDDAYVQGLGVPSAKNNLEVWVAKFRVKKSR